MVWIFSKLPFSLSLPLLPISSLPSPITTDFSILLFYPLLPFPPFFFLPSSICHPLLLFTILFLISTIPLFSFTLCLSVPPSLSLLPLSSLSLFRDSSKLVKTEQERDRIAIDCERLELQCQQLRVTNSRVVEDHTKTLERVNELWKQKWPPTWDEVRHVISCDSHMTVMQQRVSCIRWSIQRSLVALPRIPFTDPYTSSSSSSVPHLYHPYHPFLISI